MNGAARTEYSALAETLADVPFFFFFLKKTTLCIVEWFEFFPQQ